MFKQARLHANEFENEYEGEFENEYEGEFENEYEGEFEGEYETGRGQSRSPAPWAQSPASQGASRKRRAQSPASQGASRKRWAQSPAPRGTSRKRRAQSSATGLQPNQKEPIEALTKKFNKKYSVPSTLRTQDDLSLPNRQPDSMMKRLRKKEFRTGMTSQNADRGDAILAKKDDGFIPRLGYHVTPKQNIRGIKKQGLQPSKGGQKGGASKAMGSEQFQKNSQGKVHYSDELATSGFYKGFFKNPQSYGAPGTSQGQKTSLLGIRNTGISSLERDPDDPNRAFRSINPIPPKQIIKLGRQNKVIRQMFQEDLKRKEEKKSPSTLHLNHLTI